MHNFKIRLISIVSLFTLLFSFLPNAFAAGKGMSLQGYPAGFRLEQPVGNVVVKVINKRISSLQKPNPSTTWKVEYVVEPGVPKTYEDSIRRQFEYFSSAYGANMGAHTDVLVLYLTHDFAVQEFRKRNCYIPINLLDKSAGLQGPSSESSNCNEDYQQGISALNVSAFDKFDPAPKRDPLYTDNWEYQIGQEIGGGYLQTSLNSGVTSGNQSQTWYQRLVALPAWYEQGGQFAMSSVALAVTARKWRQSSLVGGNFYSGCALIPLKSEEFYEGAGCYYTGGSAATELMVALYGFDSLVKWSQNVGIDTTQNKDAQKLNWAKTFKSTFGDSLDKFYSWADQYALYLDRGKPLSPELTRRLSAIKG